MPLNLAGVNENDGTCGAAIKALVLICHDDQEDPFYYGEPGTCMDFPQLYKDHFGHGEAPAVVYMHRNNFTHPFSSTCDINISCGVEKKEAGMSDTNATDVESGEEDTSDNTASSAGIIQFVIHGYLALSLVAILKMV